MGSVDYGFGVETENGHVASGTCKKVRRCVKSPAAIVRTGQSAEASAEVGVGASAVVRIETAAASHWCGHTDR